MTQSVDAQTRAAASIPPESKSDTASRFRVIIGLWLFTAVALIAGVVLAVVDLASHGGVHLIGPAAVCILLAGLGGHLLIMDQLLGERRNAYQHGHLDGWHLGYRGLPPEVSHPLFPR